jgi:hypothetical protein
MVAVGGRVRVAVGRAVCVVAVTAVWVMAGKVAVKPEV